MYDVWVCMYIESGEISIRLVGTSPPCNAPPNEEATNADINIDISDLTFLTPIPKECICTLCKWWKIPIISPAAMQTIAGNVPNGRYPSQEPARAASPSPTAWRRMAKMRKYSKPLVIFLFHTAQHSVKNACGRAGLEIYRTISSAPMKVARHVIPLTILLIMWLPRARMCSKGSSNWPGVYCTKKIFKSPLKSSDNENLQVYRANTAN